MTPWQRWRTRAYLFAIGVKRHVTLGARAVLIDGERVFLIRQTYLPGWQFCGGGVEAGETAEVAAGHKKEWVARVIPSVAYTNPEIAWVGVTETEAKAKGLKVGVAKFPWAASGRAIAADATNGMTKLIFDKESGRVIGGAIVGTNGGELLGEIGLAIEMGADAEDLALTIHAHPTLHESVGLAAEVFEGSITDLPNAKAKKKK